jgi:alpha-L-fucosidase
MAGTNDLAQGYSKQEILANIKNMAEQAEAEHMNVILCSITPCNDTYSNLSNPKTKGAHIVAVNDMIKAYAAQKGFTYCDYYPALVAEDGYSLKEAYWLYDHLHPNPDAYTVMEGIIKPIIDSLIQ